MGAKMKGESDAEHTPRDLGRYKNVKSKVASYTRYITPKSKEPPTSIKGRKSSFNGKYEGGFDGFSSLQKKKPEWDEESSDGKYSDEKYSDGKYNGNMRLTSGPARRMHKLLAVYYAYLFNNDSTLTVQQVISLLT